MFADLRGERSGTGSRALRESGRRRCMAAI